MSLAQNTSNARMRRNDHLQYSNLHTNTHTQTYQFPGDLDARTLARSVDGRRSSLQAIARYRERHDRTNEAIPPRSAKRVVECRFGAQSPRIIVFQWSQRELNWEVFLYS